MRAVLQAISEELVRLKAEGEQYVPVTDEALAGLRKLVAARSAVGSAVAGTRVEGEKESRGAERAVARVAIAPVVAAPVVKLAPVAVVVPGLPPPPVVVLPDGDKASRWAELNALVAKDTTFLANVGSGRRAVLGVGSLDAKIFFVGDAPGVEEEIAGEPFVGPAGELLTKMIAGMGLKRELVHIASIVGWRPKMPLVQGAEQIGTRSPTPEEMAFCLPFLRALIDIVQPELIVALGGTAAQGLLGERFTNLGDARSRWHDLGGRPLMVTYHPSYLLRSNSNKSKRAVWEDLLQVMEKARLPVSERQRGYFL